jgi:hypothetical protein
MDECVGLKRFDEPWSLIGMVKLRNVISAIQRDIAVTLSAFLFHLCESMSSSCLFAWAD